MEVKMYFEEKHKSPLGYEVGGGGMERLVV